MSRVRRGSTRTAIRLALPFPSLLLLFQRLLALYRLSLPTDYRPFCAKITRVITSPPSPSKTSTTQPRKCQESPVALYTPDISA
ncbi:hypothetical protein BDW02DRAFT_54861 [Decorospora gaudefroyi]|uniref:Uncharacterized protein n=1 Tax=Decorospora gaudefroyi TaxID=184978 RepID=A0A6A5K5U3_9PLEO|nr:hypothetical protein BDW02DRAFT_54861 [Decorospora gaudefroyi]